MNIKQDIPIVGQQQVPVMQAIALVTPELIEKLSKWCDTVGLPPNEVQNTIFRLGLIMMGVMLKDEVSEIEAQKLIPFSDAEKKAFCKSKLN